MADDKGMDNTYPDKQEIDDAIELFEMFKSPQFDIWDKRQQRSIEIGIAALRYIKGSYYD